MAQGPSEAIYLQKDGKHSFRIIEEPYVPAGAQSLVEVKYSAVNPADTRHVHMGMSEYVAGYEFVGTVIGRGESSPFQIGQTIFGFSTPYKNRPFHLGAHQSYLLAEPYNTWVCPDDLSLTAAVAMPAGAMTSIDALFNVLGYALPAAGLEGDDPKDVPILIWGGAGALGQAAINLAREAGFSPIITTASPRNHETLLSLGATHCFDYRDADVPEKIHQLMRDLPGNKKLITVYDTVCNGLGVWEGLSDEEQKKIQDLYHLSTPAIAKKCCSPEVAEKDLRLCVSLILPHDESYELCLAFRTIKTMDHAEIGDPNTASEQEKKKTVEWGHRIQRVMSWVIANHKEHWKPQSVKICETVDAALQGINDVWEGRISGQKVVIKHPMRRN